MKRRRSSSRKTKRHGKKRGYKKSSKRVNQYRQSRGGVRL